MKRNDVSSEILLIIEKSRIFLLTTFSYFPSKTFKAKKNESKRHLNIFDGRFLSNC